MSKRVLTTATAFLLILVLSSCGRDDPTASTSNAPVPSGPASTEAPTSTEPSAPPPSSTASTPATPTTGLTTAPERIAGDPSQIQAISYTDDGIVAQPVDIAWHTSIDEPFIAGKLGTVHRLVGGEGELVLDMTELVTTNSERGLLAIEFGPAAEWFYVHWSDLNGDNVLSAWRWTGELLDPSDRRDLLVVEEPFANHNGGGLDFGHDGYLYWGLGDGGAAGDPVNAGQDGSTLLGSIIRIDPDPVGETYSIPPDNPFTTDPDVADEIWALGLRNPWKMEFDDLTGDLWVGDVGQDRFEEIDRLATSDGGANLGWRCFEGFERFADCDVANHHLPVLTYGRSLGRSVTGGVVYRGEVFPELYGAYVFGDFASGRIWALPEGSVIAVALPLVIEGAVGFGTGPDGEVWVLQLPVGRVGRLVPAA